MKTKVFLLVVTFILFFIKTTRGQQIDSNDVSYLSKVSLKQHVSEESYLFNYPTGYEQTVNKKQWSYSRAIKNKGEILYKKGLESLSNPKKALKFFMQSVEKDGNRDASYQVGHYYCFGVFDKTGTLSRKGLTPIDAKKGLSYLNFASPNKLCQLFADKNSWMFDPRRAVYCGIMSDLSSPVFITTPVDKKYNPKMVESLITKYAREYNFNLERYFIDNFYAFDTYDGASGWILYRISELTYLRDIVISYTNTNEIIGNSEYKEYLSSQYLLNGFDFLNQKDEPRALFNFAKAGYAGNVDGFRMTASMISDHWAKKFQQKTSSHNSPHGEFVLYCMIKALRIPKSSNFYSEYQILLEEANTKYDEAYNGWRKELDAKNEAKREKRARFWNSFAQAVAAGTAAAAQGMALAAQQQNYVPQFVPTTTMNTGFSTDYYTSPAYLNQVQVRANQSMANYQAQLQLIGQQALLNNQQMLNRSKNMFGEMTSWSLGFQRKNGREPTDIEKSQWVKQHYPDMYASYIQAQAAQYERKSGSDNSERGDIQKVSNTYDCSYCGGSGRLLQEEETLSFGLATEKEYKCKECGKWKYKGRTHRHYDCTHCKGKGKVTFN